jgi:pimeloyl-ACP methyl ester carboxylesterase
MTRGRNWPDHVTRGDANSARIVKRTIRKSTLIGAATLVAIVAAAFWIARHFQDDMRVAEARIERGSHVVQTACGPIEYGEAGTGPIVLMVHGAGGGFDQGLEFSEPLVRSGFRVIAPSRFGYLRTPVPQDASPQAQADAHACLLDALGIDKVAAIGGSAGAPSVFHLCLRHPERCSTMALVVPALYTADSTRPPLKPSHAARFVIRTALSSDFAFWAGSHLARDSTIESVLATPMADVSAATPVERERVFQVLRNIQPISRRAQGLMLDGTITTAPAQFDFEHIAVPTLLVTTRDDGYQTLPGASDAARRIPAARLVVYADGGHLWVGHQWELWTELRRFLGETHAATPPITEEPNRLDHKDHS